MQPVRIVLAASLLASLAGTARADDCAPRPAGSDRALSTCVDTDNLWARPGPGTFASVGSGLTTAPEQVSFGMLASYSSRPLRLEIGSAGEAPRDVYVVDNAVSATFGLALGVTDRLELTLAMPVTFFQNGAGYGPLLGEEGELPRSVVRDPRFGFGYALVARDRAGTRDGVSLVSRLEFGAPLGDGDAFAGSDGGALVPSIAGELRRGRFTGGVELGGRIRRDVELGDVLWGSQLAGSLGGNVHVWDAAALSVGLEAFALVGLTSRSGGAAPPMPIEWLATVRSAPFLGGDVSFTLGGGGALPIVDANATAPRFRFLAGAALTPRALDGDRDGVLDRDDACPAVREDRDGFEDADGCPEPDNDGDGIPDAQDRCRDAAETRDGFRDEDGCPDLDDDDDGIPDEDDRCRNEAEDADGFEDEDGCPDPDNDADGILDAKDACPAGAEDRDGFRDEDGCPDPDNDADGIPDDADACPDAREDRDGFEDADGCPDPDNDGDGVFDASDRCPNEAETLDGKDDEDGCPEAGATSLVRWEGGALVARTPAAFTRRSARPSAALATELSIMARLVRTRPGDGPILLEAWPDDPADASDAGAALAAARADAARAIFVEAGIAPARLTAAAGEPQKRPRAAPAVVVTLPPTPPPPTPKKAAAGPAR